MKHCYILNYAVDEIYHCLIPEELYSAEGIEYYLKHKYNLNFDEISFMTSYNDLTITDL